MEVYPQSAMMPFTFTGKSRAAAAITVAAPMDNPSRITGTPGNSFSRKQAQSRTSYRSLTPKVIRSPSLAQWAR